MARFAEDWLERLLAAAFALHVLLEARVVGAVDATLAVALALSLLSADVAAATCLTVEDAALSTAEDVTAVAAAAPEVTAAGADVEAAFLVVEALDDCAVAAEDESPDDEDDPDGQKVIIKSTW